MKNLIAFWFFFFSNFFAIAQNEQLAQQYFDAGEFEKAESLYKNLYDNQRYNTFYLEKLVACKQALLQYDQAESVLLQHIEMAQQQNMMRNFQYLWVILGYNYQLKNNPEKAKTYYEKAANLLKEQPATGYMIAKTFEDYHLIDYALNSYQWMMQAIPAANYYYQIAQLYGEKGDIEQMFDVYLDLMVKQNSDINYIQRFMGRYLTDDNQGENNILLRKLLVKRIQSQPLAVWYKTLSWLYTQQKEFSKALIQEKAIYDMLSNDINGVMEIGVLAFDEQYFDVAKDAFVFILSKNNPVDTQIQAVYYWLETLKYVEKNNDVIEQEYLKYMQLFAKNSSVSKIQNSYAHFLTFYKNQPEQATAILENSIKTTVDRFQKAEIKLLLSDIYTFNGRFNQALILLTQVQTDLKNHPLAETARYKIAQNSYYKGDFEWANGQLKVLKKGTTKLIANDAIDLNLLISDNIAQDSIQSALKRYAKADLLAFQQHYVEAIDSLSVLLSLYPNHAITDEALYKQALLFEKTNQYEKAESNYLKIIDQYAEDLLIDDALYQIAILYDKKLLQPEKAKTYFEKIVLNYPSSYYLVEARKRYRELRGDNMMP